jgi:hypothetical protein
VRHLRRPQRHQHQRLPGGLLLPRWPAPACPMQPRDRLHRPRLQRHDPLPQGVQVPPGRPRRLHLRPRALPARLRAHIQRSVLEVPRVQQPELLPRPVRRDLAWDLLQAPHVNKGGGGGRAGEGEGVGVGEGGTLLLAGYFPWPGGRGGTTREGTAAATAQAAAPLRHFKSWRKSRGPGRAGFRVRVIRQVIQRLVSSMTRIPFYHQQAVAGPAGPGACGPCTL